MLTACFQETPDISPLKPGVLAFGAEVGALKITLGDSVYRAVTLKGAQQLVEMLRQEVNLAWPLCPECNGSGEVGDAEPPRYVTNLCNPCNGTGRKGGTP